MITSRRSLLTGLISFGAAAPAIVRASSLMPVRQMIAEPMPLIEGEGWAYYGSLPRQWGEKFEQARYWLRVDGVDQFGRHKHEWIKVEPGFLMG